MAINPDQTHSTLSDNARTLRAEDRLGFTPYVEAITNLVLDGHTETPLTMGVFGPWGSGKTSLMHMVKDGIEDGSIPDDPYPIVWFDAWKYDKEDALWRALLIRVLEALRPAEPAGKASNNEYEKLSQELDDLQGSLYQIVEREEMGQLKFDWDDLAKGVIKGGIQIGLGFLPVAGGVLSNILKNEKQDGKATEHLTDFITGIERERHKVFRNHVTSLEQFQSDFQSLVKKHVVDKHKKLVVFIDDLDRCLPEKAVEVLEAIKLFLDVPGCIFVLGIDRNVIARGVEIRYREQGQALDGERREELIDGRKYLQKIIQLPFQIPVIDPKQLARYVNELTNWPHEKCADVFGKTLEDNPRQIKRTVNSFLLLWRLRDAMLQSGNPDQKAAMEQISPVRLAKVTAIQQAVDRFYQLIKRQPLFLGQLEAHFRSSSVGRGDPEQETTQPQQSVSFQLPEALEAHAGNPVLKEILSLYEPDDPLAPDSEGVSFTIQGATQAESLSTEKLRIYFTLSGSTEGEEATPLDLQSVIPTTVKVPAGEFLMGATEQEFKDLGVDLRQQEMPEHTVMVSAYEIGVYPILNYQYQAFVEANPDKSPQGWDGIDYPEGKDNHPVVNVSWEDASAYCVWLSEQTGRDYRLPTEAQWEKAARGTDGRYFPWGKEWDASKLNSRLKPDGSEKKDRDTTPAGMFSPVGDSPYGCADMVGNVWEWCADWYDENLYKIREGTVVSDPEVPEEGNLRVLRGGSFSLDHCYCRCAVRFFNLPNYLSGNLGFRIVLLSSPTEVEGPR